MDTDRLCSQCGEPLAADVPPGMCPECVMKASRASPANPTIRVAPDAFVKSPKTESKELEPGTQPGHFGDYELLEEIARGGMGVVYKARQLSLKRVVAVKMIRSGRLADQTEVARFRTEAQAAAQLQHPNIVAIHEIGEHEGRQYFSMDFVEGKNLAQIADGRPVARQKAAEWLKAIAAAVHFAHQRGVLHRDLKPQNIMVDAEGRAKVTDFGLAKNLAGDSTLTHTGAVMGSPSYMPPEQARGRNDLVGPASDVYSLGAILYELLTGRPPFRGKSPLDTLSQVINDEPRAPRRLIPSTPVDLETICLKCIEKEPVRRYPTARELELDLGRFLAGAPVQARPAGGLRKLRSWSKRHRWQFNVAVAALILTLAALTYGLWEQTRYQAWLLAHPGSLKANGAPGHEPLGLYFAKHSGLWPETTTFSRSVELYGLFILEWILCLALLPLVQRGFRKLTPLGHPAAPWVALTFGVPAAIGVVGAFYLAANVIQVTVWEAPEPFGLALGTGFALLFPVFAGWFAMLMEIIRQQRRRPVDPGLEGEEDGLTLEQLAPIRADLSVGKLQRAARRYRAATKVPFYEAERRVLDMATSQLSGGQLAAIHSEIFGGRFHKAVKLYAAAIKGSAPAHSWFRFYLTSSPAQKLERLAHSSVMRMAQELCRAHPEKFPAGKPGGLKLNPAGRVWWWLAFIFLLWIFSGLAPASQLIHLLVAMAAGGFLRIARWKEMYYERQRTTRSAAWYIVALVGLGVASDAWQWLSVMIHTYAWTHSGHPRTGLHINSAFTEVPGLIIGWLLMQLWLRRHKVSSMVQ